MKCYRLSLNLLRGLFLKELVHFGGRQLVYGDEQSGIDTGDAIGRTDVFTDVYQLSLIHI